MITYVDTSSVLKLLVDEPGTGRARQIWAASASLASVTLVEVEGRAALAAAERARRISTAQHRDLRSGLAALVAQMSLVDVTRPLVGAAGELADTEALRGYDAVHLAAALFVGADVLTSADTELCAAARRRGLFVSNPLDG